MTVPVGRLRGQNFAVSEMDESRSFCRLVETDTFELSDCLAAKVELEEPIPSGPEFARIQRACRQYPRLFTPV